MRALFLIPLLGTFLFVRSQEVLQPGFSGEEYRQLLQIFARQSYSGRPGTTIPAPAAFDRAYRSPELGLKNRWDLWYRKDGKLAVIMIRGTVQNGQSWLENFYAAMVPATGSLRLNDTTQFAYRLAKDSQAMVHAGWLIGMASLAPTILEQIRESYAKGYREFILAGHSQGAAIAFLLRSYLFYLQEAGSLPADLRFKTYCSAAPKPGNLYYAYDFDFITRNGWAFSIVNSADWVPETPFSVQTFRDFNPVNPFSNLSSVLGKQPLPIRLYLKNKFRKMDRATVKAQKRMEKYLGKLVYKQVRKTLPRLQEPAYAPGNNYQRAGQSIVLLPDEGYRKIYPDRSERVFVHHLLEAYYYLSSRYYP